MSTAQVSTFDVKTLFGRAFDMMPWQLAAAVLWTALYAAAPYISKLLEKTYPSSLQNQRNVINWNMRVVSQVHAVVIVCCALAVLLGQGQELAADRCSRLFGHVPLSFAVFSLTGGYFVWDAVVSIKHARDFGLGFVVHSMLCLVVYLLVQRPFGHHYALSFLLFELSTPFVNNHWFFDKLGLTGSTAQLVNGAATIFLFLTVRILFGFYKSMQFLGDTLLYRDNGLTVPPCSSEPPTALVYLFVAINWTLNGLNVYWFVLMIQSVLKRRAKKV